MWKVVLMLLFIASFGFARNIGEYMRGVPSSRVLQLSVSCPQSCMSSGRGWTYSFMLSETVRGGANKYYEYPADRQATALNILRIQSLLPNLNVSSFASLKARELLRNRNLANSLAGLVPQLQARIPELMQRFALSGQDKVIVRIRLQGADGRWVAYPIVFYGDGRKATSIGLQLENVGGLNRLVAYYFPVANTVDLYVNDVIGSWPPPPNYNNVCPEGISNCYGKYIVQVVDEYGNISYRREYSHNGAYDNDPEGFIRSVLIPLIPTINQDIEQADLFFFRAGQYYYNEDKGDLDASLDYQRRLLRFMDIYVWDWDWETERCLPRLALRRFYRYDNVINYTYSIRQVAEIYNIRQHAGGDWNFYLAGIEDIREYDANFTLEKRVSTCGLTPEYVSQRVINPGMGRSDLLEILWFQSLGQEDNPLRSVASPTEVYDRIDINCCSGQCEDPRRYDPCPGFP